MTAVNPAETAIVIQALEEIDPAPSFLLNTFAGELRISDTKKISMDLVSGNRRVAPLVHPDHPAKVGGRSLLSSDDITPGYLKPLRKIWPSDLDNRLPGEVGINPMSRDQRLTRLKTRDAAEMRDENNRWEEYVLALQLTTGIVSIAGEGMDLNMSLPILASHNKSAAQLAGGAGWNGGSADAFQDFREAQFLVNRDGILNANIALYGKRAWDDFLAQTTTKEFLNNRTIEPNGSIILGTGAVGAVNHGSAAGLSHWTYNGFREDSAGAIQPLIPDDVCVVASTQLRVVRAYGRIATTRAIGRRQEYVREWTEENPEANFVSIETSPLPFVQQVNGYVILNTR